jgi:DHA2 family multidrug resistance protein
MLQLLGGSVGIAVVNTYVTIRTSMHRIDLLQNVSLSNPAAWERFQNLARGFQSRGYSLQESEKMALGALEGTLSTQSAIISYAEGFMLIGIICLACMPLILLAKVKKEK